MTAQQMSHYYSNRIARMPLLPVVATTVLHDEYHDLSPFPDHSNDYYYEDNHVGFRHRDITRNRMSGAEDAAHELERSILGDFNDICDYRTGKRLGKANEVNKRLPSDSGSDMEVARHHKDMGPAHKRRKLDSGENDLGSLSASLVTNSFKGKGKGRQREGSLDSISVNLKPSKRKGSRKKHGLGPELELELASHPFSVSGDATPTISISRPSSPVHGMASIIYEIDEHIPPLKKAKKVDEPTMIKRIKTLEEAQRKVWTNIARRDMAKACNVCFKKFCLSY